MRVRTKWAHYVHIYYCIIYLNFHEPSHHILPSRHHDPHGKRISFLYFFHREAITQQLIFILIFDFPTILMNFIPILILSPFSQIKNSSLLHLTSISSASLAFFLITRHIFLLNTNNNPSSVSFLFWWCDDDDMVSGGVLLYIVRCVLNY